jgi:ABC-type transport system involved in cytochrome bd biosynthesis fused ATPase/permease subunit
MNRRTLNLIIPIVSVAVMVIWGTLAKSYEHSWLAVFVGGILMAIINVVGRNKDK